MKTKLLSLFSISLFAIAANAQVGFGVLDINSVRAGVNSNSGLFWDYTLPQYEIPAGGGAHTMYAGGLWIGGLDTGNQLHLAGQTYHQTGSDFFNGPVMNQASYSPANDLFWAKVWKINKATIDSFLIWRANPSIYPNYTVPASITSWPGNGDVNQGQAPQLAPFYDYNADGIYDPSSGDYPCIKGDQALFFIFNDDRAPHTETGGQKFGIEIHAMLYAYKAPGTWLDSTVFLNYRLFNRTNSDFDSLYLGSWTDFDIGAYDDDYVGCDVMRDLYYGYNGDVNDGTSPIATAGTYGANPPAQGVLFLRGPEPVLGDGVDNDHDGTIDEPNEFCTFNRFVRYNNNFTPIGNPTTDWDYYKYMQGRWLDSTLITYGGNGYGPGIPAAYMFPATSDPLGIGTNNNPQPAWDESIAGNTPSDRHGLGVSGPFPLPGQKDMCIDFAYVFGRGNNGPLSSVAVMQNNADSVKNFYNTLTPCTCTPNPLGIQNPVVHQTVRLFPNPANENVTVYWEPKTAGARMEIYDLTGQLIAAQTITKTTTEVKTESFPAGVYMLRITDGATVSTAKLVKE